MKKSLYAEKHAESVARRLCGCVTVWRAPCVRYQNADCMASDIVGKRGDGSTVWIQVTTGGANAVNQRKRKMAQIPWSVLDTVLLFAYPSKVGSAFEPTVWVYTMVHSVESSGKGWVLCTSEMNKGFYKHA